MNEIVVDDVEDVGDQGLQEDHVSFSESVQGSEDQDVEGQHRVAGRKVMDQLTDDVNVFDVKNGGQEPGPEQANKQNQFQCFC